MFRQSLTLPSYFESHYVLYRSLAVGSIDGLRRSIRQFCQWLGREPLLNELCDEMLSRWVIHLEATYAPITAHNKRCDVLGVWLDAFNWDKTGSVQQPRRVRSVKVPEPEPDSWSDADVARLASAARSLPGRFLFGALRGVFIETTIHATWESGLRRADVQALTLEHVAADGTIQKTQSKTGHLHCGKFSKGTLEAFRSLGRNPPLAWVGHRSGFEYWLGKVRELAGLGDKGQLQRIRASAGTHVAIHQPGMETKFLGHTTPKADKWYIDKRRLPKLAISPGRLPVSTRPD